MEKKNLKSLFGLSNKEQNTERANTSKRTHTQERVHNLIIVDASGSMASIYDQALAGINETINTIRTLSHKDASVKQAITLLSFADGNEDLQYIYRNTPVEKAKRICSDDYQLRGLTALYDAIGESVSDLRRKMNKGDKALVTIITDGCENDSHKWNGNTIMQLISKLRSEGWVFTYIGANQDVEQEANKMGIVNSLKFEATVSGTINMFEREAQCRERWNERRMRGEKNLEADYFAEEATHTNFTQRITPERIEHLAHNEVFVFGSNMVGKHNGGASLAAVQRFGAQYGVGEGAQGQSYAIPTVGCEYTHTAQAIQRFIRFAESHPQFKFLVTRIGCGNGGWHSRQMAQLFANATSVNNIYLPKDFWQYLRQ